MGRGAATGGGGAGGYVPPTLNLGAPPIYWSPHFYHNIYFDRLVPPPTYKIVPAPLHMGQRHAVNKIIKGHHINGYNIKIR